MAFILLVTAGWGHDPKVSGIRLILNAEGCMVSAIAHQNQLTELPLDRRLKLRINGRPWIIDDVRLMADEAAGVITAQALFRAPIQSIEVLEPLIPEDPAAYTVVSVFREGRAIGEATLNSESPPFRFGEVSTTRPALSFFMLGITHFLSGTDHLLFICGLLLGLPSIGRVIKLATCFTVGHAVTISLSALGHIALNSRIVEPLIALSLVVVAIDSQVKRSSKLDLRLVIAGCFGMVHGLGFAGALTEVGLPKDRVWLALFSFNFGIEVVQIGLIAIALPLLRKSTEPQRRVIAMLVAACGLLWIWQRLVV